MLDLELARWIWLGCLDGAFAFRKESARKNLDLTMVLV